MIARWPAVFALLVALPVASPGAAAEAEPQAELPPGPFASTGTLTERYEALVDNDVAWTEARAAAPTTITDPFTELRIVSGVLAPVRTARGAVVGAVFRGECAFSYTPPRGVEAEQLTRTLGRPALQDLPCTEFFALSSDPVVREALGLDAPFGDDTLPRSRWIDDVHPADPKGPRPGRHKGFIRSALRQAAGVVEADQEGVHPTNLYVALRDDLPLRLAPELAGLSHLAWAIEPGGVFAHHEPALLRGWRSGPADERLSLTLASHPLTLRPEDGWRPANVDVVSADLDFDIQTSPLARFATLTARATLTLTTTQAPVEAVRLSLARTVKIPGVGETTGFHVGAIRDFEGQPLDFLHEGGDLLIRLRSQLPPGQGEILTIEYEGNAMPRLTPDSFGLLAGGAWWPQPGLHDRLKWSASLCVPAAFRIAGSGTTVSESVADGRRCERWEEPELIAFPAINMGRWQTGELTTASGTRIRAFFLQEDADQIEPCLKELERGLAFYEGLFGPYPYAELDVAQARENMGFWQAPAGLIELSKSAGVVRRTAQKDQRWDFYPHVGTATLVHELGHQWWGHVVGWKTYRGQWVSETFSEYASMLYMAQHHGLPSYEGRLEYWQQAAKKADRYGPMSLGFRIGGQAYQAQVYRRGPMVLHMLRRLVGDAPFTEFLSAIPAVAAGRNLDTEDILLIAGKQLGPLAVEHLTRWVTQTGLPDLEVSYQARGKQVAITLEQTQPEAPYRLVVPIEVTGKRGKARVHEVVLEGRSVEVLLPLPGGELKRIRVDPGHELLLGETRAEQAP